MQASSGATPAGGQLILMKVNVRLVNKDLLLPEFPCMPSEQMSKFVEKMCNQFMMNKESVRVLSGGKFLQANQINYTLKDAGIHEGSTICLHGGSLTEEYQSNAFPRNYNKAPGAGAPLNVIQSRISALRHFHQKGVTKVKIPTRQEQAGMEYLKAEMRGEEQKCGDNGSNDQGTPSKQGYFSRFLPKLTVFGTKSSEKDKKGGSGDSPREPLVRVLEQLQMHKFQANDAELKHSGSRLTAEQIAWATEASKVLRNDSDNNRTLRNAFGGLEHHSALLDLLRQDERLSGLFSGIQERASSSSGQARSSGAAAQGGRDGQANALAQALFGPMMQRRQERARQVVVDPEHLQNMTEMGFPESRCRRALRYFHNDFEQAIQHVVSTTEAQDDTLLGPEPPEEENSQPQPLPSSQSMAASQSRPSQPSQQPAAQVQVVHEVAEQRPRATPQIVVEEFKADNDALNMLLEMGYAQNDALIALKVTSNNLENACTFLMSNPNPADSLGYQVHVANQQPALRQQQAAAGNSAQDAMRLAAQTQQRAAALYEDVSRLEAAMNQLVQQSNSSINRSGDGQEEGAQNQSSGVAGGNSSAMHQAILQQPSQQQLQQPAGQQQQNSQQNSLQQQLFMNHHLSIDSDELDFDEADYYDHVDQDDELDDDDR